MKTIGELRKAIEAFDDDDFIYILTTPETNTVIVEQKERVESEGHIRNEAVKLDIVNIPMTDKTPQEILNNSKSCIDCKFHLLTRSGQWYCINDGKPKCDEHSKFELKE